MKYNIVIKVNKTMLPEDGCTRIGAKTFLKKNTKFDVNFNNDYQLKNELISF